MSNRECQTTLISEPKRPKTHGSIWNICVDYQICPRTERPYVAHQHVHPEAKGDRMVMVEEFTCSECGETIKKFERNPHILYS